MSLSPLVAEHDPDWFPFAELERGSRALSNLGAESDSCCIIFHRSGESVSRETPTQTV